MVSLWGARRRSFELSSSRRMERAVKKERTAAIRMRVLREEG